MLRQELRDWGGHFGAEPRGSSCRRAPRPIRGPGEYSAVVQSMALNHGLDAASADGRLLAVGYCHTAPSVWLGLWAPQPATSAGVRPSQWTDSSPVLAPEQAPVDAWLAYWQATQARPLIVGSSYNDTPEGAFAAYTLGMSVDAYPRGYADLLLTGRGLAGPRRIAALLRAARVLGRDGAQQLPRRASTRDLRGLARLRPAFVRWAMAQHEWLPAWLPLDQAYRRVDWAAIGTLARTWASDVAPQAALWQALRVPAADWEPGLGPAIASAQAAAACLLGDARVWVETSARDALVRGNWAKHDAGLTLARCAEQRLALSELADRVRYCPRKAEAWASAVDAAREAEAEAEAGLRVPWLRGDGWEHTFRPAREAHEDAVDAWQRRRGPYTTCERTAMIAPEYGDGRTARVHWSGTDHNEAARPVIGSPTAAVWWLQAATRVLAGGHASPLDAPIGRVQGQTTTALVGYVPRALEMDDTGRGEAPASHAASGPGERAMRLMELDTTAEQAAAAERMAVSSAAWAPRRVLELPPDLPEVRGAARAAWAAQQEREAAARQRPVRAPRPAEAPFGASISVADQAAARAEWAARQEAEAARRARPKPRRRPSGLSTVAVPPTVGRAVRALEWD